MFGCVCIVSLGVCGCVCVRVCACACVHACVQKELQVSEDQRQALTREVEEKTKDLTKAVTQLHNLESDNIRCVIGLTHRVW